MSVEVLRRKGVFLKKYKAWRKKGGLEKLLKKRGYPSIWKAGELHNPQPIAVESLLHLFMILPAPVRETSWDGYFAVGDRVTLYRQRPDDNRAIPVDVPFTFIFAEKPWRVTTGCCGRYSLAQGLFMVQKVGGDVVCGGDLEHLRASRTREQRARQELQAILAGNELDVFVHYHTQERWNWCFSKRSDGTYYGFAGFYLGAVEMIDLFLRKHPESQFVPIHVELQ